MDGFLSIFFSFFFYFLGYFLGFFLYFLGASVFEFPITGVATRVIRLILKAEFTTLSSRTVSLLSFVIASAGLTFLKLQLSPEGEALRFFVIQQVNLGIWLLIDLCILDKRAAKAANTVPA